MISNNIVEIDTYSVKKKQFVQHYKTLQTVADTIRDGQYKDLCQQLHNAINGNDLEEKFLRKLPVVRFGIGDKNAYTGRILLSFRTKTRHSLERLRHHVNLLPSTMFSFAGSSGLTLKVVLPFTRPDGTLPEGRRLSAEELNNPQSFTDEAVLFHEYALQHAAQILQMQLGLWPEKRGAGRPETGCRISSDAAIYFNPEAVSILLEQPSHPLDPALTVQPVEMEKVAHKAMPEVEEMTDEALRYQWCLLKTRRMGTLPPDIFYTNLADYCFNNNVSGNFALLRIKLDENYSNDFNLAMSCFLNVFESKHLSSRKTMTAKDMQVYGVEAYLNDHYLFRRNGLTEEPEYIDRNLYSTRWSLVTEQLINTIVIDLQKGWYQNIWDKDIWRYIHSHYVQTYNPIDEYLSTLPTWDGTDRVAHLACAIHTDNPHWSEDFHTWMLGMVSQWMGHNRLHPVSMTPMLISPQGTGKSTFCRHLLPPELRPYYVEHLDFLNKEHAERALSRFCLINLDEFDKITERQMTFLKYIQTLRESQTRQMYTTSVEVRNRYAAFIATTNSLTPLRDVSGSRRYLCIALDHIDQHLDINYPQLYAQLKTEVEHGSKVYFTAEEEQRIQETNKDFQYMDEIRELFIQHFEKPATADEAQHLSPTDIADYLHKQHKYIKIDHGVISKIGKMLRQLGFTAHRANGIRYYDVRFRSTENK